MIDLIRRESDLLLLVVNLHGPTLEQIETSLDFLSKIPACASYE